MTDTSGIEESPVHAGYRRNMQHVLRRVDIVAGGHRRILNASVIACIVIVVAIFFADVFLGPLIWLKILGIILLLTWLAAFSRFLAQFNVPITCLGCDQQINLNQDWVCGYCDDAKSPLLMQTYVRYHVPLEKCMGCGNHATAVECPYCNTNVVFDIDRFNIEEQAGTKRFGVARFL